jgi:hypothetical protein
MACALTQGFNLDCRDSYGGVKQVFIMEFENASAITLTANVVTGITKLTGKKFWEYKLVAHTAEAEETLTSNRENGTNMVKQSVKFPINKMSASVRAELMLLARNRLLIVIVDENGVGWLYGYGYGLMSTSFSAKTGKVLSDRNGYELSFEGDEKELAYSVDNTTLGTLTTAGS